MIGRLQQSIENILAWLLNPLFFHLRNTIKFSRKKPFVDKVVRLESLPQYAQNQLESDRYLELKARFKLDEFADHISWSSLYGAYFFLDVLEKALSLSTKPLDPTEHLRILDVGTKNFDAAPALYNFFRHRSSGALPRVDVTGIEIDAYRVYRSLFSRYDVGRFYERLITFSDREDTPRYLPGDFLGHEDSYNILTCFFPFMSPFALLAWGLPTALLAPRRFLDHMITRLQPNGLAIIVNQTKAERDIQIDLLEQSGAHFETFEISLEFRENQPLAYLHLIHG